MTGSVLVRDVVSGAAAGSAATVAMSAVMWAAQQAGLMGEQPPERVARRLLGGVKAPPPSEHQEDAAALALHLGFGLVAGAAYGSVRRTLVRRLPPAVAGAAFGLAVWAVSYQGWIPALGILPQPKHDRPGRPRAMVAAHLVYGAVLGALLGRR